MPLQIAYRNLGSGPLGILLGNWCAERLPTSDKRSVLVFGHCGNVIFSFLPSLRIFT